MFAVSLFMGVGALSLSGIPPFSGFYSKDAIIATTLLNPQTSGLIATLTLIAGILSIAYIGRLWFLTFAGENRDAELYKKIEKPSFFWITLPLAIMAVMTFVMGFYQDSIMELVSGKIYEEPHIKGLVLSILSAIIFVGFVLYLYYVKRLDIVKKVAAQPFMQAIHQVLFNGYYVEFFIYYFSREVVVGGIAKMIQWIDIYVVDATINATVGVSQEVAKLLKKSESDLAGDNSGVMIVGLLLLLIVLYIGGAG